LQNRWGFRSTTITEEFTYEQFTESLPEGSVILLWVKTDNDFVFPTTRNAGTPQAGARVITFGPRDD
jgi:hypothetical protein